MDLSQAQFGVYVFGPSFVFKGWLSSGCVYILWGWSFYWKWVKYVTCDSLVFLLVFSYLCSVLWVGREVFGVVVIGPVGMWCLILSFSKQIVSLFLNCILLEKKYCDLGRTWEGMKALVIIKGPCIVSFPTHNCLFCFWNIFSWKRYMV